MQDSEGHRVQPKRDKQRNLGRLISPNGRTINFKYDEANRIVEATDDAGSLRRYSYDSAGDLKSIRTGHLMFQFEYGRLLHFEGYDSCLLTAVRDGKGTMLLKNSYGNEGRISEQRLANGDVYHFDYIFVN
jgi:YD repeat-containing protein